VNNKSKKDYPPWSTAWLGGANNKVKGW